jgi:simple sugar transport system permease protein
MAFYTSEREKMKNLQTFLASTFFSLVKKVGLIIFAIAFATLLVAATGYDPFAVVKGLWRGITGDIGGTLRWTTPLIMTGLSVAIAFRTGAWNLGADGQLYLGAIATTAVCLYLDFLPGVILLPLSVLGGILAGAAWGWLAGFLRVRWGAKEVVTTVLLNYIAFLITDYLVSGPLKGGGIYGPAESSNIITEKVWFPRIMPESSANIGLFLAIGLAVILYVIMYRSTLGYEFKVVGTNRWFGHYGGIPVQKVFVKAMALSGGVAGLAGTIEILGIHHRFPKRFSHGLGFDGIAVALLAGNNPLGVILSGFFFGGLRNGSYNIERLTDVPRAMVIIIQAVVILTISAQFLIKFKRTRVSKLESKAEDGTLP